MDPGEPGSDSDSDFGFGFGSAPPLAFPTAIPSPAPRRLSSSFSWSKRPLPSARKRLAYVSLQGRLVGAEEATSARAVGGFGPEEIAAWQLFSPIQRVVLVAVIGVAVAESKKNRLISQLRKSVELRDQILSSMQQKLDNLCGQVHNVKEQPVNGDQDSTSKNAGFTFDAGFQSGGIKFVDCGCWLCDQHQKLFNGMECNAVTRRSSGFCLVQGKPSLVIEAEQEERRMSDLSDWASSVTSVADIQMNALAIEQDVSNLKQECEEKDATIRELSEFLHSSEVAGSKRIAELEDIIRRKNMVITKLKKDMAILEQKVVQLTRLRRPSTQKEDDASKRFPFMADNILYDMDSTTSPSASSDSDSSPGSRSQSSEEKFPETAMMNIHYVSGRNQDEELEKALNFPAERIDRPTYSRPGSPLGETSTNQKLSSRSSSMRLRQLQSASGDSKRSRPKQAHCASRTVTSRKGRS